MFSLSERSKRNRDGVDKRLIDISDRAIQITKIDFGHPSTGGVRTDEQQNELYKAGKSKADGYNNRSKHQDGLALDFYAYVNGRATWKPEYLAEIACAFYHAANELGIKIKWGGLFKGFSDMPHIQLED